MHGFTDVYSYTVTVENGSATGNEFTMITFKKVSFQETADTPITLEGTSSLTTRAAITQTSNIFSGKRNCKFVTILGVCCLVLLFALPIILYYVEGGSEVSSELQVANMKSSLALYSYVRMLVVYQFTYYYFSIC